MKFFCVPDKYLYPLPELPKKIKPEHIQKPIVLLVTDMNIMGKEETEKAWKKANKALIDELFCVVSHGYASANLTQNVPLCKNGKFAFVDTEHPKRTKFQYRDALYYLSPKMKTYWKKLVKTAGKAKNENQS